MRGRRDVEQVEPGAAGHPPAPSSSASIRTARCASGIQAGLGSPCPGAERIPQPMRPGAAHRDRVVPGLHDQCDDRPFRPVPQGGPPAQLPGTGRRLAEELRPPRRPPAAVDQQRAQRAHRVGTRAVAGRLDVGLVVGVERGRDRHARGSGRPRANGAVRRRGSPPSWSGSPRRAGRTARQGARRLHPVQQFLRPVRPAANTTCAAVIVARWRAAITAPVRLTSTP